MRHVEAANLKSKQSMFTLFTTSNTDDNTKNDNKDNNDNEDNNDSEDNNEDDDDVADCICSLQIDVCFQYFWLIQDHVNFWTIKFYLGPTDAWRT